MTGRPDRRERERAGRRAESLAALSLSLTGHSILARRVKTPVGEIDIVARRGRVLAFVEVKARRSRDAALEAVTVQLRRRVEAAAQLWAAKRAGADRLDWRFDVIVVRPWRWPEHVRDAWRP